MIVILLTVGIAVLFLGLTVGATLALNWAVNGISHRFGDAAGLALAVSVVIVGVALIAYPMAARLVQ